MDRLRVLHAFVRVVEVGSFTAVADELKVKQSTVSKWLRHLEAELDTSLIDRTTRAQRITEAGRRLYERATEVLAAYETALSDLRAGDAALHGRIRASVPAVFGRRYLLPPLIELLVAHPELELDLAFSDRYVRLVEAGFDVAVRVGVPVDSTMVSHPLGRTPRRVVASPRYLSAHGYPRTPGDLGAHSCLLHSDIRTGSVWQFRAEDGVHRATVRGRIAANQSEALRAMATQGLGIALLASWLVDEDIQEGRLVSLLPRYEAPEARIVALTPPGRRTPPRVRALIEHVRGALAAACFT